LYVIIPTTAGPMNPGKVAIVLVSPMSVPTMVNISVTYISLYLANDTRYAHSYTQELVWHL